ncbi:RNA methyltransferase [bacterium]|nr:RNA methyltransferase [bacterium]RQV95067.1 MAG: TrmH family RNA methyltransferase [bacterium]
METKFDIRSFDSPLMTEDFLKIPRCPVTLILDNLRSAFNVGSIVRTADCALVEKVYFCGITAHPPHKKLDKTSLGAMPYVPWEYRKRVTEAVSELKEKGIPVIGLELTSRSQLIWDYVFPMPVGLILGNEALGVSQEALLLADDVVEIPMLGYKNSMNVAVALGVALYEIQRQHWDQFSKRSRIRFSVREENRQTG